MFLLEVSFLAIQNNFLGGLLAIEKYTNQWPEYFMVTFVLKYSFKCKKYMYIPIHVFIPYLLYFCATIAIKIQGQMKNVPCFKNACSDLHEPKKSEYVCWFVSYIVLTIDLVCDIGQEFLRSNFEMFIFSKYLISS